MAIACSLQGKAKVLAATGDRDAVEQILPEERDTFWPGSAQITRACGTQKLISPSCVHLAVV